MKSLMKIMGLGAMLMLLLVACADPQDRIYEGLEAESLGKWMEKHHPELKKNRQENGGYYVDVLDPGNPDRPVNDTVYWVRLEFTGRDLAGNVCLTRDELTARQIGSFTKYTHYVPFYRYCGDESANLLDGMHRALRNTLTLDADYAADRGLETEITLGLGAEVILYMPSTIVGGGLSGSGGYEGQDTYTLSESRPLVVRMKVVDLVKNPLQAEGDEVDAFAEQNGTLKPVEKSEPETSAVRGAEEPQYNDGYAWRTANDTIPQLYIHHTWKPTTDPSKLLNYRNTYRSSVAPYSDMAHLDQQINEALLKRFGEGTLEGDSVKISGTAKVWYIGRFLDGFIFDTNIDEVKTLIYGKVESEGEAISITPQTDKKSYVDSWYYSIPQLRYGQWAAVIGTSTYNYGALGQEGATTTNTTTTGYDQSYYDMINYYNYMNSYYGNSYYGGYYGNYYDYYNYGYYNNYYYDNSNITTTTTTTISTEIQSYTPLLFQLYIEEK